MSGRVRSLFYIKGLESRLPPALRQCLWHDQAAQLSRPATAGEKACMIRAESKLQELFLHAWLGHQAMRFIPPPE